MSAFDIAAIKDDFGRAATVYDDAAILQREVRARCIELAQSLWRVGAHILDAGCGTGAFSAETHGWEVTGLDIAYGMCEQGRKKHGAVINANAQSMPFADGVFEGVFSSLMLQWTSPEKIFSEIARVLKPGRSCVLSTLTEGTLTELNTSFRLLNALPHVSRFESIAALQARIPFAGLRINLCQSKTITQHYPDLRSLMESLRRIGAANKQTTRQRGLMTPRQMKRLECAYNEQFGKAGALPISWEVLYLVLQKD